MDSAKCPGPDGPKVPRWATSAVGDRRAMINGREVVLLGPQKRGDGWVVFLDGVLQEYCRTFGRAKSVGISRAHHHCLACGGMRPIGQLSGAHDFNGKRCEGERRREGDRPEPAPSPGVRLRLDGAQGSGKTSIIEALRRAGFEVVVEAESPTTVAALVRMKGSDHA